MKRFLAKRLWQVAGTVFGVVTLIFFLQRLTGDPTYLLVPETATKADIEALRHSLGFDRPLVVQYLDFLADLARFDLGRSLVQSVPVLDHHRSRAAIHLASGRRARCVVACGHRHSRRDPARGLSRQRDRRACLASIVLAAQSMPTFWSGILMILVFAVHARLAAALLDWRLLDI